MDKTVLVDAIDINCSSMHHIVIGAIILGHVYRCVRRTICMVHLVHGHRVSWDHSVLTKHAGVVAHPLSSSLIRVVVNVHARVVPWLVQGAHSTAISPQHSMC
jgi:hypothetical protein